ncbi:hypothetical protein SARC_12927, partial [Sphaeroforma arctica JP610]
MEVSYDDVMSPFQQNKSMHEIGYQAMTDSVRTQLVARGTKYEQLATGQRYIACKQGRHKVGIKLRGDGRAMLDTTKGFNSKHNSSTG